MSFTRWIKILCYAVFLSLLSYLNLYSDIKKGIEAEKNIKKEQENLGYTYFITASSGILIFLFTNSRNQIKRKFGIKVKNDDSINDDTEYILPSSYSVSATTTATSKVSEKSSVNDAQSPTLANISLFQNKMNNEIQSHTGASANTSIYQNSKSNEMRSPTLSVGNSSFYQNKSPSEMRSKTLSVSNFYLHKLDNEIRANTSFNYKRMTNEIRSPVNTSFNQNIISNELHSPVVASAANTSFNQDKMTNEIHSPTVATADNASFVQNNMTNETQSSNVVSSVNTNANTSFVASTANDNALFNPNKTINENLSNDISGNISLD